jgi:hypothetical protein
MPIPISRTVILSSLLSGKKDEMIAIAHVEFRPAPIPPSVYAMKLKPTKKY